MLEFVETEKVMPRYIRGHHYTNFSIWAGRDFSKPNSPCVIKVLGLTAPVKSYSLCFYSTADEASKAYETQDRHPFLTPEMVAQLDADMAELEARIK